MLLSVCVGSSCHLKGAYRIIHDFKEYIAEYELSEQVELKANFCVGECLHAVNVRIDEGPCRQVLVQDSKNFFEQYVLGGL